MFNKKMIISTVSLIGVAIIVVILYQFNKVRIAHSSFEHYYAFRGCSQLIAKTDTSGVCMTPAGQIISIVEINNKWYLEGDGPVQ